MTTVIRRTAFVLLVIPFLCLAGCPADSMQTDEALEEPDSIPVQAALFVFATSESTDLSNIVHDLLLSQGCRHCGEAWLYDGSPAGSTYDDLPHLVLSVSPERERRMDVRLYYRQDAPAELQEWIDGFCEAIKRTPGVDVDVYEQVSTGPF